MPGSAGRNRKRIWEMSEELDLEPIKDRATETTEGEWKVNLKGCTVYRSATDFTLIAEAYRGSADAQFIAHAKTDIPALIAEVERLRIYKSEMVRQLMETSVFTAKQIGWSLECVAEALVNAGVQGVFAENSKLRTQIERVRGLHKPAPVYEPADVCKNDDERHVDERHAESECGEELCLDLQLEYSSCEACSNPYDELTAHPCATIRALGGDGE